MSSSQKASAETSDNVAKLHKLLQRPESKDRIGPLMAAIMAQNIHIHTNNITDLDSKVQKIRGSQSEQANHVSERIHEFQQDLRSLRELIPADKRIIKDIKADIDELKDEITEAMKQCHVESARIEQDLKIVREMMETRIERDVEAVCETMEREQQASKKIAGNYKTMMQHVESLTHGVNGIKGAIEKKLSDPLITESVIKLEEKVARSVDQISTIRKDIGDIKTSLAVIETKGRLGNLVWKEPAGHGVPDQSTIHDRTLGYPSNNQEPQLLNLENWPAVVRFVQIYEQFRQDYKSKKPENETQFIETFLNTIDIHVSCMFQRHLLEMHPSRVALIALDVDEQIPTIFIHMRGLRWSHVGGAIRRIKDLRVLQCASDERLTGPWQSLIVKQENQKRRAPTEDVGTGSEPSTSTRRRKNDKNG